MRRVDTVYRGSYDSRELDKDKTPIKKRGQNCHSKHGHAKSYRYVMYQFRFQRKAGLKTSLPGLTHPSLKS